MADEVEKAESDPGYSDNVMVFTDFFNREAMMYALGDIKFSKPKSIRTMLYVVLAFVVWAVPWTLIIGIDTIIAHFNVYLAAFVYGVPVGIGVLLAKPIWRGKPFFNWLKCLVGFLSMRPMITDGYVYEGDARDSRVDYTMLVMDAGDAMQPDSGIRDSFVNRMFDKLNSGKNNAGGKKNSTASAGKAERKARKKTRKR